MKNYKKPVAITTAVAGLFAAGYGLGQKNVQIPMAPQSAFASPAPLSGVAASAPLAASDPSGCVQNLFVNITDRMMPSVVNIFTTKNYRLRRGMGPSDPYEMWRRFFGDEGEAGSLPGRAGPASRGDTVPSAMALGSGFIIESNDEGGLILTNHHVIAGADDVKVKFTEESDEKETPATVVGSDPELDIALLRVKTKRKLQAVALGDSERLKAGEWIAALGNPFGHGHSISHGIVSAKARSLPGGFGRYLQVDAPINPGNSGGPLVNMSGEVVGINNAIDARGAGIGFAIPINAVKALLPQIKSSGHVERGFIGIGIEPLRPELARALKAGELDGAALVTHVAQGGPADRAGIEPYDVITEIDGKKVRNPEELLTAVTSVPVGKKAEAKLLRSGKELKVRMDIAKRPDLRQARNE